MFAVTSVVVVVVFVVLFILLLLLLWCYDLLMQFLLFVDVYGY